MMTGVVVFLPIIRPGTWPEAGLWSTGPFNNFRVSTDLQGNEEVLDVPTTEEDAFDNYILREEVVEAIRTLKTGKSPGVDNIPTKLVIAGGEDMTTALHHICNKA